MSAAALAAELRAAGIRLAVEGDRLVARGRRLPPDLADRLRAHKAELVALLTGSQRPQNPQNARDRAPAGNIADIADGFGFPAPMTPCLACGTSAWFLAADWPTPGRSTWLCRTCSRRPSPSLRDLVAGLTAAGCARLDAEAAAGDLLAQLTLAALAEGTAVPPTEVLEDAAITVTRALAEDGPGWVVIYSAVLGEELVFARDGEIDVPEAHAALARFDRDELAVLAAERASLDRLRAIVDVKREIPGARVVRPDDESGC